MKKEQELLEQKQLVERKLALEREKAEKEKKEKELAQAAQEKKTSTVVKPSPASAARTTERKTLPPIPLDNYFHQDWITIIQATQSPVCNRFVFLLVSLFLLFAWPSAIVCFGL
jgi:sRNA-binding protein